MKSDKSANRIVYIITFCLLSIVIGLCFMEDFGMPINKDPNVRKINHAIDKYNATSLEKIYFSSKGMDTSTVPKHNISWRYQTGNTHTSLSINFDYDKNGVCYIKEAQKTHKNVVYQYENQQWVKVNDDIFNNFNEPMTGLLYLNSNYIKQIIVSKKGANTVYTVSYNKKYNNYLNKTKYKNTHINIQEFQDIYIVDPFGVLIERISNENIAKKEEEQNMDIRTQIKLLKYNDQTTLKELQDLIEKESLDEKELNNLIQE